MGTSNQSLEGVEGGRGGGKGGHYGGEGGQAGGGGGGQVGLRQKSGRGGPLPRLGRVGPGGLSAEWRFGVRRTGGGSI